MKEIYHWKQLHSKSFFHEIESSLSFNWIYTIRHRISKESRFLHKVMNRKRILNQHDIFGRKVSFWANKFHLNLFSIYKISFVSSRKKEQRSFTSCQLWNIPFYCHCQQVHYRCDRGKDTGIFCSFAGTTINIKTSCKVMNHVHRCRNKQQKKVSDLKLKWNKGKRVWDINLLLRVGSLIYQNGICKSIIYYGYGRETDSAQLTEHITQKKSR